MEVMDALAKKFLEFRGVEKPQDLKEEEFMEFLRYYTDWGDKVVNVIKYGNNAEKWEAISLARKALDEGKKVCVWQHIGEDIFPNEQVEMYKMWLED